MWEVSKEFKFDAAHSLPHLPEMHKCHRLHGHTYTVRIVCRGYLDPVMAWVIDYVDIAASVKPIIEQLDHRNLNDVLPIITTAENLAFWLWTKIKPSMPSLYRIDVHETTGTCCSYSE